MSDTNVEGAVDGEGLACDIPNEDMKSMHAVDRCVLHKVMGDAIADGYRIDVHNGVERTVVGSQDMEAIFVALGTTPTDYLIFSKAHVVDGSQCWIRLVNGRDAGLIIDETTANLKEMVLRAKALTT